MPEGLEIELYRRLAETAVGRRITEVHAPDAWFLKRGLDADAVTAVLTGARLTAARRTGKLLLLDTDRDHVLGLRFGMTGRLLVDGHPSIERLEYSSPRDEPKWDRFGLRFEAGGDLVVRDPRRLGAVELDPREDELGADLLSVTLAQFRVALGTSTAPIKARLLDQARVAGLGNLLVDEMLWRAGIDPARPTRSLTPDEVRRLHRTVRSTARQLLARGGSHLGDLMTARERGGLCPRDGSALERRTIGGRTTYSCPAHQV